MKNDPRLVAATRELRDRWLEQVNERRLLSQTKYEVSRIFTESWPMIDAVALPTAVATQACMPAL